VAYQDSPETQRGPLRANHLAGASAKAGRRLGYLLTSSEAATVDCRQTGFRRQANEQDVIGRVWIFAGPLRGPRQSLAKPTWADVAKLYPRSWPAPTQNGSRLKGTATVEFKVPLIGGKIESIIGRQLVEQISSILRFTAKWITEQPDAGLPCDVAHTRREGRGKPDTPKRHEPS
jgi:hypothetical protein